MKYLTLTELRAKLGNRSRSAIYADLAAERLPQPIKLGGRIYWAEGDIDAHLRGLRGEAVQHERASHRPPEKALSADASTTGACDRTGMGASDD
jgi:prophage regulatory protein